jgi:hypothetical protein
MAKGAIISDDVRSTIMKVFLKHQDWRAKEIQREVHRQLYETNPNIAPDWPGLSAIQKEVGRLRKVEAGRLPEEKALEEPWYTFSLKKYPIPPEAVPAVLRAWIHTREVLNEPLSIREAQWVSRLYATFDSIETLTEQAQVHALQERMYETIEEMYETVKEQIRPIWREIRVYTPAQTLGVFSIMTGEKFTRERQKKIIGVIEKDWQMNEMRYEKHSDEPIDMEHPFRKLVKEIKEAHQ